MLVQIRYKSHNLELEVAPSDTVLQIKEKVEVQEGVAPENIRLLFCGMTLQDEKTVEACGVKDGSVMFVLQSVPAFAAQIQVGV